MNWRQSPQNFLKKASKAVRTSQGLITLSGLFVGLCYFPVWFGYLFTRALEGAVSWFLIVAMLSFVVIELWHKRELLDRYNPKQEDKALGQILIISGVLIFPFCRFALWSQSLVWLMILLGIIISAWGLSFFLEHKLSTVFLCLTVYPKLGIISRIIWEFFFPSFALESLMAKTATFGLNRFGLQAIADRRFMIFPEGRVLVGWGCNGLDMAITVAFAGLFMGLIFQQPSSGIIKFMSIGILMAFLANIPRLMLVAVAYVYWGQEWFNFWHGFWGGQVFSAVIFTIYYYMLIFSLKSKQK